MPAKKKSKSKKSTSKRAPAKRKAASAKKTAKKKTTKAKTANRSSKKQTAPKKKSSAARKRAGSVSSARELDQEFRGRGRSNSQAARRSEDFEGLSQAEDADSESVDELVEEGNVFEAGAVAGVEEADDADEREVHTHEVPEDDVPKEYLDED